MNDLFIAVKHMHLPKVALIRIQDSVILAEALRGFLIRSR
jgi:hypothetical protein